MQATSCAHRSRSPWLRRRLTRGGYRDELIRENAFHRVATENQRMRHLVDRLIILARMDRLPAVAPQVVDVAELAGDAIAARAVNGAAVPLVVHGEPPLVRDDPADLHEAIGNLVENATKYGKDASVTAEHDGDCATVRVRDSGPGIPAADARKIFERFYRGESAREIVGSGLGLTTAGRGIR
jgi:signal transduction histidine kinase